MESYRLVITLALTLLSVNDAKGVHPSLVRAMFAMSTLDLAIIPGRGLPPYPGQKKEVD
tara:strand:- start:350 stop:526 length:177 start_codon:yes stop_codon:yes gene_type:complete